MSKLIGNRRSIAEKRGGGGIIITAYATFAELQAEAATSTLNAGYYSVDGTVVYFDGSVFSPTISEVNAGQSTQADSVLVFPEVEAEGASTIVFLAPSPWFPGIRDYSGLYTDAELSTAATLSNSDERGINAGYSRKTSSFVQKPSLLIYTDLTFRCLVRLLSNSTSRAINLFDFGGSGETEATNFLYNFNLLFDRFNSFSESGGGVDGHAYWFLPIKTVLGRAYIFEVRRVANVETAFLNGLQLGYIIQNTAGSVNNATGAYTRVQPTGGTSGVLAIDGLGDADCDVGFVSLGTDGAELPAPDDFAAGKAGFTALELADLLYDDFTAKAAHPNIVSLFRPIVSGIEDVIGTVGSWTSNTIASQKFFTDHGYWGISGAAQATVAALRIDGNLTINMVFMVRSIAGLVDFLDVQATGETASTNFLYLPSINGSTSRLNFFYEYGAGVNNTVSFEITPITIVEIREYRWTRTEIGGGSPNCEIRAYERIFGSDTWTQLTVASVTTGSGVGTQVATVPTTVGSAGTQVFRILSGSYFWREISIFNAAIAPT